MIKVGHLIEILEGLDPEAPVFVTEWEHTIDMTRGTWTDLRLRVYGNLSYTHQSQTASIEAHRPARLT